MSREIFWRVFHSSLLTSFASHALSMPGLTSCSASPLNAYDAQRMPVPSLEPLDETDNIAPLCPVGPAALERTWPCWFNKLLARSNGMTRNGSFSGQM